MSGQGEEEVDSAQVELHIISGSGGTKEKASTNPSDVETIASQPSHSNLEEEDIPLQPQAVEEEPKEEKKPDAPVVSISDLFKYATPKEKALIWMACISAVICGAIFPCKSRHTLEYLFIIHQCVS